jgi:O-methyltransferase
MNNIIDLETRHNKKIDEIYHQLNIGNVGNVVYWNYFFNLISNVKGDIVECGIGRGRSLLVMASLNKILFKENERIIYAYDSFEGFPEPTVFDESPRNPKKGEWSHSPSGKYKYNIEFMKRIMSEADVNPDSNIVFGKGFFSDTLPRHPANPIAILHVDGDLYKSYIDTLENLYDKVTKGGVIVFDDFIHGRDKNESWPGARKAVKDFLGERFNDLKVSFRGNYYLVK